MKIVALNKKASFDYFLSDFVEAGIVLEGSEVKSVRAGNISLVDTFVQVKDGEVWLKNCYIKPYENSSAFTPDARRNRKLLLSKNEILKLEHSQKAKGFSCVPTKVYFKDSFVKVEIALAKGKKLFDKRETLKEKQSDRDLQKVTKNISRKAK